MVVAHGFSSIPPSKLPYASNQRSRARIYSTINQQDARQSRRKPRASNLGRLLA
jgi:hypothetical protein